MNRLRTVVNDVIRAQKLWTTVMGNSGEKTIWEVYNERTEFEDKELVRECSDSLNTLLIFVRRSSTFHRED